MAQSERFFLIYVHIVHSLVEEGTGFSNPTRNFFFEISAFHSNKTKFTFSFAKER